MSVITTVKVYHCANGDGVNNGQNGWQTILLYIILITIRRAHLITVVIIDGAKNFTCKQTLNRLEKFKSAENCEEISMMQFFLP